MFASAYSAPRLLGRPPRPASAPLGRPRFSSLSDIRSSYESACRPAAGAVYSPNGRPVGCLSDFIKGAKDVLDDSGYRRSVHRHGGHDLRLRRYLIVSATLSGSGGA